MKITPIKKRILVQPCFRDDIRDNDGNVLLCVPESVRDFTNWCRIIDIAKDCKLFQRDIIMPRIANGETAFVVAPDLHPDMSVVDLGENGRKNLHYLIKERQFVTEDGTGKHPYILWR